MQGEIIFKAVIARWAILYGLLLVALPLQAQPSGPETVIVRLQDASTGGLQTLLSTPGLGKANLPRDLAEGVLDIRPALAGQPAVHRTPLARATFVLELEAGQALEDVLARWTAHPEVAYAQPNYRYQLDAAASVPPTPRPFSDPLSDSLQHHQVIRLGPAWAITRGAASVRIGYVDTGAFFAHPDLQGQWWVNPGEDLDGDGRVTAADYDGLDTDGNGWVDDLRGYDFVDRPQEVEAGDYLNRDADPSEDDQNDGGRGHGTLIAGALAAAADNGVGLAGVAPASKLVPLRAFGADGRAEDDDIAAAIIYAADMGIEVLNLSFGDVYYSPLMHESIRYAVSQGTVVVASAGNLGGDRPHYPSDYPEVISVAWLNEEGTGIASRGTYGVGIDLGAPGSFIYTTLFPSRPDTTRSAARLYGRRSGSSLAAPLVSGVAALLRAHEPSLSVSAVRSALLATATDLGAPGWDHFTGAGLLDAGAAVARGLPGRIDVQSPAHASGTVGEPVAIVGTVTDPAFLHYAIDYTSDPSAASPVWTSIVSPQSQQVWQDTLGVWDMASLGDGAYILRLQVILRSGRTIEDRRRIYLDRSPPVLSPLLIEKGWANGQASLIVDVETDDLTRVTLKSGAQDLPPVLSDRLSERHGLAIAMPFGGLQTLRIEAENQAGLVSVLDTTLFALNVTLNTGWLAAQPLAVPDGFMLDKPADFDRDGLQELVLNRFQEGWLGDTLQFYEWAGVGEAMRRVHQVVANVFPRDVGDADGDGRLELLTQVGGATLLLEQSRERGYPDEAIFVDTTGLANPFDPNAAFGARITDLDQDGRGELLTHNTVSWRVLEYDNGFEEAFQLINTTGVGNSEVDRNAFEEPEAIIGDFDDDGRTEVWVGDSDGDLLLYEITGNNQSRLEWQFESDRYRAGSRLAAGDLDGDGLDELVSYTQTWTQTTADHTRPPDIGEVSVWRRVGTDAYALLDRIAVMGPLSRHGSTAVVDFDQDGREELVIVHAPLMMVLQMGADGRLNLVHVREPGRQGNVQTANDRLRSATLWTGDLDQDGFQDLVAGSAEGGLVRYYWSAAHARFPAPRFESVIANETTVSLTWESETADSVQVYWGLEGGGLDPLVRLPGTADQYLHETTQAGAYALQGYYGEEASPLSQMVTARPHAPAVAEVVGYPAKNQLMLQFSEPLDPLTQASQFLLDGREAGKVLVQATASRIVLRFKTLTPGPHSLTLVGVRDSEGAPVGTSELNLVVPGTGQDALIVSSFEIIDASTLDLLFNNPLLQDDAVNLNNYTVRPNGRIIAAEASQNAPNRVRLRFAEVVLGATGRPVTLTVSGLVSVEGIALAPEGATIQVVAPAQGLAQAYVYPNPYRSESQTHGVMIAGLPEVATIRILGADGQVLRVLSESDGDGGIFWDLLDRRGQRVPSGVYLVYIEAPDHQAVIRKAALVF